MASKNKGLRVTFKNSLRKVEGGFSPGGAVFPTSVVKKAYVDDSTLDLRGDYRATLDLQNLCLRFVSDAPYAPRMSCVGDMVVQILDIASGSKIFPLKLQ